MDMKKISRVLFIGDSITDCGRSRTDLTDLGPGYPKYVAAGWRAACPHGAPAFVNSGVSGDRTKSLLARYDTDFLPVKPDFISILIGINDAWRAFDSNDPTTCEQYAANYRELYLRLRRDFPKAFIMAMEPYLLPTDPKKAVWHPDLDPKIQAARALASEFADAYLPLDGWLFSLTVGSDITSAMLSADGVHPTEFGHRYIAAHYLDAIGFDGSVVL